MRKPLACPQGHVWEAPSDAQDYRLLCPVCALPLSRAASDVPTLVVGTLPPLSEAGSAEEHPLAAAALGPPKAAQPLRFRILQPYAEGGLGKVSLARDEQLQRDVALKQIKPEMADQQASRQRFINEARVTGQLEHPNIVPVYALGWDDSGRPYYAMKLVKGRTLQEAIEQYHAAASSTGLRELLQRLVSVCQAIAYAHDRGIIHRDLKPSNIMLGDYGETMILDWGIAKRVAQPPSAAAPGDGSGEMEDGVPAAPNAESPISDLRSSISDPKLTMEGQTLGTPPYMSPEQTKRPDQVGPAADIYSLGAILFQILTGQPPHSGPSGAADAFRIRHVRVLKSLRRKRQIPRPLEAICLKALSEQPEQRYAGANDLAHDLERWLADEPVTAHVEPLAARTARWARRHRTFAVTTVALLVAGIIALSIFAVLISLEKEQTEAALDLARDNEQLAREELLQGLIIAGDSLLGSRRESEARERYGAAWQLAEALGHPDVVITSGLLATYVSGAPPVVPVGDQSELAQLRLHHDQSGIAITPDGRIAVAVRHPDRKLTVIDLMRGTARPLDGPPVTRLAVAISPDGKWALSGGPDDSIVLWNLAEGKEVSTISRDSRSLKALAFSPDGSRALSAEYQRVRLWDLETQQEVHRFEGHTSYVGAVAFSSDGRVALSGSQDETARLWDLTTGEELRSFLGNEALVTSVAISPDGRTVVSGGMDCTIRIWDLNDGRELQILLGHRGWVRFVGFTQDGNGLISAASDGTVRIWDVAQGLEVRRFSGRSPNISGAAFAPAGEIAVAIGGDRCLTAWSLSEKQDGHLFRAGGRVLSVVFAPDARLAAIASFTGEVHVLDAATGHSLQAIKQEDGLPWCVAISPDGQRLAYGGDNRAIVIHELHTAREIARCMGHTDIVTALAFSPDGDMLTSSSSDHTVRLWDSTSGEELRRLEGHTGRVRSVVFAPDGQSVLSGSFDKTLRIWDVGTGTEQRQLMGHTHWVHGIAITANGKIALSGSWDMGIRLWDMGTGEAIGELLGSGGIVYAVAASPDGRLALSGGQDLTLRLWNLESRAEIRQLSGHQGHVTAVAFSGDGRYGLSGDREGIIRIWDFQRPHEYRQFHQRIDALTALDKDDPKALATLGEWYAFRGLYEWAAEMLEQARAGGAEVSSLELARCYWQLDRLEEAEREFRVALERGEAPADYLNLCITAVSEARSAALLPNHLGGPEDGQ